MDIKGKVFIVTGGASGLGEGTARMLAASGGTVVIADMQAEKGEAIAKEINGAFVKCDVTSEADGQAVVAKAVSMGKLMGLVNCAGIATGEKTVGKNGAHNFDAFKRTITINLIGSFNMIRLAADAMCKNEPESTGERGVPKREGKGTAAAKESCTSCGMPNIMGVPKMPGAMVMLRMPLRAKSRAIGKVMPTTPPLDAL